MISNERVACLVLATTHTQARYILLKVFSSLWKNTQSYAKLKQYAPQMHKNGRRR